MDTRTGKLYENYDDAVADLRRKNFSDEEIAERLMSLDTEQFKEYSAMNRHERRKAAKLARAARGKE
jgi:hypothetical protein